MVNYSDPNTIARESLAAVKVWHVMNGIFIWEFFTTLDYEWDAYRGKRPCGWTIWVYSFTRVATLMSVILNMVGFDTATRINCQLWTTFQLVFSYLAIIASSLLILLRVIAIWNRQRIVFVTVMAIWMADIAFLIGATVRFRSSWSTEENACVLNSFESISLKLATYATLFTDVVLLLIMLVGLLRIRLETGGAFSLGPFLWKQGIIWLLIATIAEVPPVVLMILNLNVPLNLLLQNPCMVIVAIAATRMYRSLINFCSSNISQGGGRAVSEMPPLQARSGPVPLNRMVVSVRTEGDQIPTSVTSQSLYVSTDQPYKAHEVSLKSNAESGLEK